MIETASVPSPTAAPAPAPARPSSLKVWLLACRPKTLATSLAPVAVGSALAASSERLDATYSLLALLGALLLQIGCNLFNDYADFVRGADGDDRLGPPRASQLGWLSPRSVAFGAGLSLALAMPVGVALALHGGWPLAAIGAAGMVAALAYTGGPYPLAYHGLGELFVMLFFGQAAVCGTYFLNTGELSADAMFASVSVGALATALIAINNLRDRETDRRAGKWTLAARFGERFARRELVFCFALAYAIPLLRGLGPDGLGWWLPLLSAPLALFELRALARSDGAALNARLGGCARLGLIFGALLSLGVCL